MRRRSWKRTFWVLGVLMGLEAVGFLGLAVSGQASWFVYIFAVMLPFMYFYPSLWAFIETMPNLPAIAAINLLVGWSLIGWFVLLIYLVTQPSAGRYVQSPKFAPTSGQTLSPDGYYYWDGLAWRPVR
jgi:hypothetical protein